MDRTKRDKFDKLYMEMALTWSKASHCVRKRVGSLIVKDQAIISDGINGTPTGFENACELPSKTTSVGETKWYVMHAEANALAKLAKGTQSGKGATIYTTLSPCRECSKMILQSGLKRVVYMREHSDTSGLHFLREAGVEVNKIEM